MFWNKYLLPSLIALVTVALLNWVATVEYYYWTTSWFDWVVHFFGGVWVAAFALWVAGLPKMSWLKAFLSPRNLILAVFAVGFAWEIYELAFHLTNFTDKGYAWDTTHDLLMDVAGAFFVAVFANKKIS